MDLDKQIEQAQKDVETTKMLWYSSRDGYAEQQRYAKHVAALEQRWE